MTNQPNRQPASPNGFILTKTKFAAFEDILPDDIVFRKDSKKVEYANIACAFDIETTSFYRSLNDPYKCVLEPPEGHYLEYEKACLCYAYVIGMDGKTFIGRTLEDAVARFRQISGRYELNAERRIIFYIHNADFEFNFIRKYFNWLKVFAVDSRSPLTMLTDLGIEFRCSHKLTNYPLSKVGEHLNKYKVRKMLGDLDYYKLRHSGTKLTKKEIGYIINDGLVVMAHVQEEIERLGGIEKIPLTSTGYVRNTCRLEALYNGDKTHRKCYHNWSWYRDLMKSMPLSLKHYSMLKSAFQGGFTHASCIYSGTALENIGSYDFTSAYPAVMVMEKFPLGTARKVTIESMKQFKGYLELYCCLFTINFAKVKSKIEYEHYISKSKCRDLIGGIIDNGRVVEADSLTMTITECDYMIIEQCYSFESISFGDFLIYRKGYLPTEFVRSILTLYKKKTTLKNVESMEVEYQHSKEELNATFGMSCTDLVRLENVYEDGEWKVRESDAKEQLSKYNKSYSRFLSYEWGVWITAYNRLNLWTGIKYAGDHNLCYVYSDTDSIKVRDPETIKPYIEWYNKQVKMKLRLACDHHKLPFEMVAPKTNKGEVKMLGVWDYEGIYDKFKTLGAKRYLTYTKEKGYSMTVAGVNKKAAMPYLEKLAEENKTTPFELFTDNLTIPADYTGKLTHTYIDFEQSGYMIDYRGKMHEWHNLSGVHLEKASYSLSLSIEYLNYLFSIKEKK